MTVVQITFGEIPSALTWMAQDLHINKIQMIRLLLRKLENGENVAKDYPCFAQQRGKKRSAQVWHHSIHGSHNLQ